jgi:hypothetical protein
MFVFGIALSLERACTIQYTCTTSLGNLSCIIIGVLLYRLLRNLLIDSGGALWPEQT